jgi:hypothetical protein
LEKLKNIAINLENGQRNNGHELIFRTAREIGLPEAYLGDIDKLIELTKDGTCADISLNLDRHKLFDLSEAIENASSIVSQVIGHDPWVLSHLRSVCDRTKKPLIAITMEDVMSFENAHWGKYRGFQQDISEIFCTYRNLYLSNIIRSIQNDTMKNLL